MKFKEEDIGKRVLLILDPEKDRIAKALGASKVEMCGIILELSEDYVKIQPYSNIRPGVSMQGEIKEVPYSSIKGYEFLEGITVKEPHTKRIIIKEPYTKE